MTANQDQIDAVQEAQEQLLEAIATLKQVAHELKDRHAEAYLIDHLEILASDNHGFVSHDFNISEWLEQLQDEANEERDIEDEIEAAA